MWRFWGGWLAGARPEPTVEKRRRESLPNYSSPKQQFNNRLHIDAIPSKLFKLFFLFSKAVVKNIEIFSNKRYRRK